MALRKTNDRIDKWFSIGIILLPFLYQYKGIGAVISFGELIVFFLAIIALIEDKFKMYSIEKPLLAFYVASVLLTFMCVGFSYFNISLLSSKLIRLVFYGFVINLCRRHFRIEAVEKIYLLFVGVLSVYLIIQYVYHMSTGGYLPTYINHSLLFPPEARTSDMSAYYQWQFRPSSLFLEPSYFSFYVMPSIFLILFKSKKSFVNIVVLIVAILATILSTASSGIVGVAIIFAVYVLGNSDTESSKKMQKKSVLVLCLIIGVAYFVTRDNRIDQIIFRLSSGGSISQRVTRGIIIFAQMPLFHKLFGVGINNIESYMIKNNLSTMYDEANLNYTASFTQTLAFSGIIGFLFLVVYLFSLFKKTRLLCKLPMKKEAIYSPSVMMIAFLIIIYIMFYESILFTYRFTFLIAIFEGLACRVYADREQLEEKV